MLKQILLSLFQLILITVSTFGTLYPIINDNKKLFNSTEVTENSTRIAFDPLSNLPLCTIESSLEDFPEDIFTSKQRKHGAILLHLFAAIYFFTLLAVICNDYFLPSVGIMCSDLNISKDVGAATFMAMATTTPEFFTNTISTFITKSDIGLGTIIGSLLFNTLGVAALAGLASKTSVTLEWWPISRDCFLYTVNMAMLVIFAWDGVIELYESIILVVSLVVYLIILFQNARISPYIITFVEKHIGCFKSRQYDLPALPIIYDPTKFNNNSIKQNQLQCNGYYIADLQHTNNTKDEIMKSNQTNNVKRTNEKSLWKYPKGNRLKCIWWLYTWPIKSVLTLTIPNPKTWRKMYPVTFIMCVVWIGINSYMIVWMITVMGDTINMPESVMGLTFLAAGGCTPEAISSVIMIRKGESGIGVSNSLGANSLSIVMSLGVPWLIRNLVNNTSGLKIKSYGIEITLITLILATVSLFVVLTVAKYRLKKTVGTILMFMYSIFITICVLLEMDILLPARECI